MVVLPVPPLPASAITRAISILLTRPRAWRAHAGIDDCIGMWQEERSHVLIHEAAVGGEVAIGHHVGHLGRPLPGVTGQQRHPRPGHRSVADERHSLRRNVG